MALEAGTVTIAEDKTVTGTGLAKELAAAFLIEWPYEHLNGAAGASIRRYVKSTAEQQAAAIIGYLLANAVITVTVKTTDAGLQRDPASADPTLGPSTAKTLEGTLT
jgi:hypothetical protein